MYQDSYDISDNSESSNSRYSRQEHTCLLNSVTVCISHRHHLGFCGPWVCVVSALVFHSFVFVVVVYIAQFGQNCLAKDMST